MLGLFTRIKDPVEGSAQVVSSTRPPDSAVSGNVRLNLVVRAEGLAPYSTEVNCIAPRKKWPFPGETLPVIVERSDPQKLKIQWDDVVPHADRSRVQAEQMAAAMRGEASAGTDPALAGVPPEAQAIVEQLRQAFPGAQVNVQHGGGATDGAVTGGLDPAQLQALLGGAGVAGAAAAPQEDPEDEMLSRLERLTRLREKGMLTDEEFAEQKRRILDGA